MKEKQLKDYEAHLRKMGEMAKDIGIEFTYIDDRGILAVSSKNPFVLENLITANMYRQDVFAKAIINAVSFFFSHKKEMKDAVTKLREQDALNEAKSAVDNLLRDSGFK